MPTSEKLAIKALELDNTLGEAHAVLGDVRRLYHWDWAGAEKEYKLAIGLDPTSYQAPYGFAFLMSTMGRHDEAIALSTHETMADSIALLIYLVSIWGHVFQEYRRD